jgi:hypothetical protein
MGEDCRWLPAHVRLAVDGCNAEEVDGVGEEMEGVEAVDFRIGVSCISCDPCRAFGVSADCWDSGCDSGDSEESVRSVLLDGVEGCGEVRSF